MLCVRHQGFEENLDFRLLKRPTLALYYLLKARCWFVVFPVPVASVLVDVGTLAPRFCR